MIMIHHRPSKIASYSLDSLRQQTNKEKVYQCLLNVYTCKPHGITEVETRSPMLINNAFQILIYLAVLLSLSQYIIISGVVICILIDISVLMNFGE